MKTRSGKRVGKRKAYDDEQHQHAEEMSADNGLFDSPSPQLVTPQHAISNKAKRTQKDDNAHFSLLREGATTAKQSSVQKQTFGSIQQSVEPKLESGRSLDMIQHIQLPDGYQPNANRAAFATPILQPSEVVAHVTSDVVEFVSHGARNTALQSVQQQDETRAECSNGTQAMSLNLTDVVTLEDESSTLDSKSTDALVTVNGYRVTQDRAPLLRDILAMHGDIAAQCYKLSDDFRSLLVEKVCDLVQQLKSTNFVDLTKIEIERFQALVADIQLDNVNVGWLGQRLGEIHATKSLLEEYRNVKQAKEQKKEEIKGQEDIIRKLQEMINAAQYEIEVKRAEKRQLDDIISHTKNQVGRFYNGSLTDGIL